MGLNDLLHFDQQAYLQKISRPFYPDPDLYDNIHRKRRQTASSGFSIGAGVALAPVTAGMSLASSAYGARTLDIANKKLALLEWEWARRGYAPLPHHHIRDTILPMAVSGAVNVLTLGMDMGLGSAGANAVSQAGVHGMGQILHGATHGYAANHIAPQLTDGFERGFGEAVHHVTSGAPFPSYGHPPPPYGAVGEALGVEAAQGVFHYGAHKAAHNGQEYMARHW
jgi:hypothetical protein